MDKQSPEEAAFEPWMEKWLARHGPEPCWLCSSCKTQIIEVHRRCVEAARAPYIEAIVRMLRDEVALGDSHIELLLALPGIDEALTEFDKMADEFEWRASSAKED